jgi:hypothetical protein
MRVDLPLLLSPKRMGDPHFRLERPPCRPQIQKLVPVILPRRRCESKANSNRRPRLVALELRNA